MGNQLAAAAAAATALSVDLRRGAAQWQLSPRSRYATRAAYVAAGTLGHHPRTRRAADVTASVAQSL